MNKKFCRISIIITALLMILGLFLIKSNECYIHYKFNNLQEYSSYTTFNGNHTISLRMNNEVGLFEAIRLDVFLIDNKNNLIEYMGRNRVDYYNDFTPFVEYSELIDRVIVIFHSKHFTERLEIICD